VTQRTYTADCAEVRAMRERMRQLAALCKASPRALKAREARLGVLEDIAAQWRGSGTKPARVGQLSSGEFVAVCLASRNARELDDAFYSFVMLDGWLQRWVLEQRGLAHFAETKVGTDEI
jgi:hypothetical protein